MKRLLLFITCMTVLTLSFAQKECEPYCAYLINNDYQLFMKIDFYNESISIPGQELYGQVPGYIGRKNNSFCWLITSAEIRNKNAYLSLINDYGSEDFTAILTQKNDSIYIFQYSNGNTFKMPYNGKWQKMPKKIEFKLSKP